jgi:RNA polymerase sigma-70 factor (ECF subfamily)
MMDDIFLIEQVRSGNKNAFKILILRYQRMIFSFLSSFRFPNQVTEDLAQETFLKAYKSISSYDPQKGASFSTWLFTIARNQAINVRKRDILLAEKQHQVIAEQEIQKESSEHKKLELQNLKKVIQNAIHRLPKQFQTALVLSYFKELTLEEIANIEDCPVGTIKSRIFRGKKILRNILQKEGIL